jgi:hypothetical protein
MRIESVMTFRSVVAKSVSIAYLSLFGNPAWGSVVTDSTGVQLGELLSFDSDRNQVAVITSRGYLVNLSLSTGEITSLQDGADAAVYRLADCSGQPYARYLRIKPVVLPAVLSASQETEIMYAHRDASVVPLAIGDSYYRWVRVGSNPLPECLETQVQFDDDAKMLIEIEPNDPVDTGIGAGPFAPPFSISYLTEFADGFEQEQS